MDNLKPKQLNKTHTSWLTGRGISKEILELFGLYSNLISHKLVIPIYDKDNNFLFNKYRRDLRSKIGPKYTYDIGAKVTLYNSQYLDKLDQVIICEGELDVLILESFGFNAVTSTGGAVSFQKDWAPLFDNKDVYVCLDNDDAGRVGTIKICKIIPHAKVIPLPIQVGIHGDITDFFSGLHKTAEDLKSLMEFAEPIPQDVQEQELPKKSYKTKGDGENRIDIAKKIPLKNFIDLNSANKGNCPFHTDKTPSFQYYPETNTWYCFSCGAGRDTIDFIQTRDGVGFKEAIDYLLK